MKRRKALSLTAAMFGGAIVGAEMFLSGCTREKDTFVFFSHNDVRLLDEIGETILPETANSPGAKAAQIGNFMRVMVRDCYSQEEANTFFKGLHEIQKIAKKDYGKSFVELSSADKTELLTELDTVAKSAGDGHYFIMMKQLTIWGYFTSESGMTKALRFNPIPGRFDGCVPYDNKPAWA